MLNPTNKQTEQSLHLCIPGHLKKCDVIFVFIFLSTYFYTCIKQVAACGFKTFLLIQNVALIF